MRTWLLTLVLLLTVTVSVPAAHADLVAFGLSHESANLVGGPVPNVAVQVLLNSPTLATVFFFGGESPGFYTYLEGSPTVAVNINAAQWAVVPNTGAILNNYQRPSKGFDPWPASARIQGSGAVGDFGPFALTFSEGTSYANAADYFSWQITNTSGTWGSAHDVLTGAAAHVFLAPEPGLESQGFVASGFVSNEPRLALPAPVMPLVTTPVTTTSIEAATTPVAEPGTILLLGTGLLLVGRTVRRRVGGD